MITVCMATYNGERYLREQLTSILAQLNSDDEIIVSDDSSSDSTIAIIESFADKRIRILPFDGKSIKLNFANALKEAKGTYIFFSDQDDIWLPGKVECCCKALQNVDLVVTNSKLTDENLNIINPNFFSIYNSGPGVLKNILNNTYYGSCMAFRRTILDYALPLPKTMEIGHDNWIGITTNIVGKVQFINTPFLLYRRHGDTATKTDRLYNRSNRPLWIKIWSRVVLIYHLCIFIATYKRKQQR